MCIRDSVKVEIREQSAYISGERLPGAGGMPTGTNGRAMLLLSGGIDSPVAGHMMARRGLELGAVHFYSYPYTSEEARDKVIEPVSYTHLPRPLRLPPGGSPRRGPANTSSVCLLYTSRCV